MRTPKIIAKLNRRCGFVGRGITSVFVLVAALALGGCETGPPMQEMSDARMAIEVARDAGAAQLATGDLRAAESLLTSAQRYLSQKAYSQARTDALAAKSRALDALENAESVGGASPRD